MRSPFPGSCYGLPRPPLSEGYTSGSELIAHFALGTLSEVDVVVSPPHQPDVTLTAVPADRHLRLPDGC